MGSEADLTVGRPEAPAAALPAPVAPGERHTIIDIIRGFALFGVLLANMMHWTADALTREQRHALPTADVDKVATFLTATLIDGKFYTLFSMLFGLGFAVQLVRAEERGAPAMPTYTRRLGILLVLGLLNAVFLWGWDVLHTYALLGFVLIAFAGRSDRTVLGWAIGAAVLSFAFPFLERAAMSMGWQYPVLFGRELSETEIFEAMSSSSYAESVVGLNWAIQLEEYGRIGFGGGFVGWYLSIFWKFLLGFYLGRSLLLQRAEQHLSLFRRIVPWALMLGLAGNIVPAGMWAWDAWRIQSPLAHTVVASARQMAVFALAMGYLCALVLLFQRAWGRSVLGLLAPVGRMALTNYLVQGACIVLLFHGVGLGLVGEVGAAGCVVFSLIIFSAQIALSAWWLARFRFGPAEWVWRSLTYGERQPLRK